MSHVPWLGETLASVSVCDTGVNMAADLTQLLIPHLRAAFACGTMLLMETVMVRRDDAGMRTQATVNW